MDPLQSVLPISLVSLPPVSLLEQAGTKILCTSAAWPWAANSRLKVHMSHSDLLLDRLGALHMLVVTGRASARTLTSLESPWRKPSPATRTPVCKPAQSIGSEMSKKFKG